MKQLLINDVAQLLLSYDNVEILTHIYPDGDTIGSAYALCMAMQSLGKNVRVITTCKMPKGFVPLIGTVKEQTFEPDYVVSVDVASLELLGDLRQKYCDKINLCIDHHSINSIVADNVYVDSTAAATGEIMYEIIKQLNVELTVDMAKALYLAISTDTGCFRYSNTTSRTMRICADLLEYGIDNGAINHKLFEEKSPKKIELERLVYDTLTYFAGNKGAMIAVTQEMLQKLDIEDADTEGLAAIPRQIEGVIIGVTVRQKDNNEYKISVRTTSDVNAADICAKFGGGGHRSAAGCNITADSLAEVKSKFIKAVEASL